MLQLRSLPAPTSRLRLPARILTFVSHSVAPLQLGYPVEPGAGSHAALAEEAEVARTLVILPVAFTPMRPILEGAFAFVLLILFLGCMTDMAGGEPTRTPASLAGLITTLLLCGIGFQGMRMGSAAAMTVYWVMTALLLVAALAGVIKGVMQRAVPHAIGMVLGIYTASTLRGRRFYV